MLYRMVTLRWPARVAITICGLCGVLLPAAYGALNGIPQPVVHDEFSYLLGSDTFARGRLTNPSPPLPEFFEAPHVLVSPTYTTKYPPGQAAALALGQVLFGSPIWGVWLTCGAFAASICWMLLAWTSRPWAIATTGVAVVMLGISGYWAQSYWGGMVAATGGALLLGGLRRFDGKATIGSSTLMGMGTLLVVNSRPFEGGVLIGTALAMLCILLATRRRFVPRSLRALTALIAVLLMGGIWMGYYNRAVTGSWTTIPYALHTKQYLSQGIFLFSPPVEPLRHPPARVARFNALNRFETRTGFRLISRTVAIFLERFPAVVESTLGVLNLGDTSLGWPYRPVLFWILVIALATLRDRWSLFSVAAIGAVAFANSLVLWWFPHYTAPVVPLGFATMASVARAATIRSATKYWPPRYTPILVLVCASVYASIPLLSRVTLNDLLGRGRGQEHSQPGNSASPGTPAGFSAARIALKHRLDSEPGPDLIFVRYQGDYTPHLEWVYNGADPGSAEVIYAHDLGDARNRELATIYGQRTIWLLTVSNDQTTLLPYRP